MQLILSKKRKKNWTIEVDDTKLFFCISHSGTISLAREPCFLLPSADWALQEEEDAQLSAEMEEESTDGSSDIDSAEELGLLQEEAEMSLDQLREKYVCGSACVYKCVTDESQREYLKVLF